MVSPLSRESTVGILDANWFPCVLNIIPISFRSHNSKRSLANYLKIECYRIYIVKQIVVEVENRI